MNCLFCNIIKGDTSSFTIFEDEIVKVIMDAYPEANGHMLILPKKHIEDFTLMDSDTLSHIFEVAKEMKKLIYDKLNPDGLVIVNNYGCAQAIKHYHLHLIPAYKNKQDKKEIKEIFDILTK